MVARLVGRDTELAAITGMLDGMDAGPVLLGLSGEAGIGKTTVWNAGLRAANKRGLVVLSCCPAASEVRLSYAGLTDLLSGVTDVLEDLPRPQRRALDAALLRSDDHSASPDQRAAAAGLLSVLNGVAAATPVLVAIDDVQWLDDPTRRALLFAVRRCVGAVAILFTERSALVPASDDLHLSDPSRERRLRIEPLGVGELYHVLLGETGRSFSRPVMVRIVEVSGGNPYFALEIARSLDERGVSASLPSSLSEVVQERLGSLDQPVRDALLVVSALADPRLDLVGRACGRADVAALLAPAEDNGLVELSGGRVRFTHPVLAEGVYTAASSTTRRGLHARLAGMVDDVEAHARHLALAATGVDTGTVQALEAAAEHARSRGATSAAAELLELAMGLGANEASRRLQVARDHFDADDLARSRELVEGAIDELGPGPGRAEALGLLGAILYEVEDFGRAVEVLERGLVEAGDDLRLRATIGLELGMAVVNTGRLSDAVPSRIIAKDAAEEVGDDGLLAEALSSWVMVRFLGGEGFDEAELERTLVLEDPERRSHALLWPSTNAVMIDLWTHQLEKARAGLAALRERCLERGAESDLWFILAHSTIAALWAGDIRSAEGFVVEMGERAEMAGGEPVRAVVLTVRATVAAWRGRVDEARAAAQESLPGLVRSRFATASLFSLAALGMAELSVGDHAAAAQWLGPAATQLALAGINEPAVTPLLPDAVEALIALGRRDEAEPLVEQLQASGSRLGRSWAEAVGARGRGLLLASDGRFDEATEAFAVAAAAHRRLPLRYDEGRTLLAFGRLQRRRGQRRAAKASFEAAARLFDEVGTTRWAANARAELDRLGIHPGPSDRLTPTEERISRLAASGLTNREVAARLSVSPKTVEANLSRSYTKLGIRSRAELGRWLAESDAEAEPAT